MGITEHYELDDAPAHQALRYRPAVIEYRWQQRWLADSSYKLNSEPKNDDPRLAYVAPEKLVDRHGCDTVRLAALRAKPKSGDINWEDLELDGCERFLHRVWRLAATDPGRIPNLRDGEATDADREMAAATHRLIDRGFTGVAGAMKFTNGLYEYIQSDSGAHGETLAEAIDTLLQMLRAAVPHITAELWARRHDGQHIHEQPWPVADQAKLAVGSVTLVVQVDGTVRDRIMVPAKITDAEAQAAAMASAKVAAHIEGAQPKKVIVRAPNLINLVTDK